MKRTICTITFLLFFSSIFPQYAKGKIAPEILLPDASGKSIALSSLKGKVVLIDFWASWCAPCRMKNEALHSVYDKYKLKGFEIYGVSVDYEASNWRNAVQQDAINWLQVNDAYGRVSTQWAIQYIPQSYLLDKDGRMIAINPDEKKLDKLLQKML